MERTGTIGVEQMTKINYLHRYSKDYNKGYFAGKEAGATQERERIYELMNSLRRGRFEFNDEVKMVLDMMKDEITKVSK